MKVAVIQFPGSNCDLDALKVMREAAHFPAELVWHSDFKEGKFDAAILPGGFAYGDHLRAGIVAAYSPAMKEIRKMDKEGKAVLGICNGFQILTEAGLLPGALLKNDSLQFICKWSNLKACTPRTSFTSKFFKGECFHAPIAHGEGKYFIGEGGLAELQANDQIVFKYVDEFCRESPEANPNGSLENIAGVCNLEGNIVGLMPHPERASEKILNPFKEEKAKGVFESIKEFVKRI